MRREREELAKQHLEQVATLEGTLDERNEEVGCCVRESVCYCMWERQVRSLKCLPSPHPTIRPSSLSIPPIHPSSLSSPSIPPLLPSTQVHVMQNELKMVREFRKKRSEMQQQLDHLRSSMEASAHDHKATLSHMEQKFFEEKLRLQREANRRIAELAEKAHAEAVR